ncbi:MAG: hypothetical protein GF387_01595 [Candidatus Portnoybacteria bacterium]|nr:hypothetical protein [Candidatus Portnoybacteria bacterium]
MSMKKKIKRTFIPHSDNDFRPEILKPKTLFILAVVLLLIKFLAFSYAFYYSHTDQFAIVTSSELISLANQSRAERGLPPLEVNPKLSQAAKEKAYHMLQNQYFAHTSPTGISPWYWLQRIGYNYSTAGENLAKDFTDSIYVHKAWMNSPSHRSNILNNAYKEIGIAVVEGEINGQRTVLAVQYFGKTFEKTTSEPIAQKPIQKQPEQEEPEILPEIAGEEIELLKGPKTPAAEEITQEARGVFTTIAEKSESWIQKAYFIILAILILIVALTVFVNIRVQYPKTIFTAVAFIILLAGVACFNGQAILNSGIDII